VFCERPLRALELAKSLTLYRGGVKIRVLELIAGVVHTRKWGSVLTRNLVKSTVVNVESRRGISHYAQNQLAIRTHFDLEELSQPPLRL
jgi:hypothetical protein